MSNKTQYVQLELPFDDLSGSSFLRKKDLISYKVTPFSYATLYRKIKSGDFPKPIKLSGISLWRLSDVRKWQKDPVGYKTKGEQQ
jgi:prophage regulatory protein